MPLIGKDGVYEKPQYPCIVPECKELAFQKERGACKKHQMEMVSWLINRVMTRPSPWSWSGTEPDSPTTAPTPGSSASPTPEPK